jgi:hypothetical protein
LSLKYIAYGTGGQLLGAKYLAVRTRVLGRAALSAASTRKALAKGDKGIQKIAAEFGVGSGAVQRIKAAT